MKKLIPLLLALCILLTGCVEIQITFDDSTDVTAAIDTSGDVLQVHFIDVGQADAALLEYGDFHMLIDGGNREDGRMLVSYLDRLGIEELDAVICTHAHEDHVGGLPSVLAVFPTGAVYAPTRTYSSNVFDDFLYYANQQGQEIIIPEPGDTFFLGDAQVTVVGPVESYADPNNTSIVLRVDYGEASFLFTGDMETEAENDMLDYWEERNCSEIVEVDVLKVGHHGSNTSTGYRFLYEVNPTYGIISCETGNSYGHPHKEPMSRLRQAGVTIFRTDTMGTVIATTDGNEISFTWENQSVLPENADASEMHYIGNKNSKKFHTPDCDSLPSEKNRVEFDTYQDAIDAGYTPCGGCLK